MAPRAVHVLEHQLALRERMRQLGRIDAVSRFLRGQTFIGDLAPDDRKNLLWVAQQHGYSVEVMLRTYATWIRGSRARDITNIERALQGRHAVEST